MTHPVIYLIPECTRVKFSRTTSDKYASKCWKKTTLDHGASNFTTRYVMKAKDHNVNSDRSLRVEEMLIIHKNLINLKLQFCDDYIG